MPDLKPNTVFLIGNGVLRVPCSIVDGDSNEERALPGALPGPNIWIIGVLAAEAAGLFCFALATTTFPRSELEAANVIFDSFEQIRVGIADDQVIVALTSLGL